MALVRKRTQTEITTVVVEDTPKTTTETEAPEQSNLSGVSTVEGSAPSMSVLLSTASSGSQSQAKKQVVEVQPKKGFYNVPVGTRSDLKADRELSTSVKWATVGILAVLSASMVMLLVYLNREYASSTAPGFAVVGRGANVTMIVVPEIVEHRTPRTWPTRKDSDLPPWIPTGPDSGIAPDTITPYNEDPYSDYPETVPSEIASEPTVSNTEGMITEAINSTLSTEPVANTSEHETTHSEEMTSTEVIVTPSEEPVANSSDHDTTQSEEMTSEEVNVTSSEEPLSNVSEHEVSQSEEMIAKEVIVTPPKEPVTSPSEHEVSQLEEMTSKEVIVTPSKEPVASASEHEVSQSEEMTSKEVIVTPSKEPVASASEHEVSQSEEMTSKEVIVTPSKEPVASASEHEVSQSEEMVSREVIVTASDEPLVSASEQHLVSKSEEMVSDEAIVTPLVSPEVRGRLLLDQASDGEEPPTKTTKTADVTVSEKPASNASNLFPQRKWRASDDEADLSLSRLSL